MSRIEGNGAFDVAGGLLLHPAALLATALLWANDHHLKASYPGVVTGKLSDVCGMVCFPLFLTGALELVALVRGARPRFGARAVAIAAAATGLVFAATKLSVTAADAYRWAFGVRGLVEGWLLHGATELPRVRHTMDPTDLVALPFLLVPVLIARRARKAETGSSERPSGVAPRTSPLCPQTRGGPRLC